MKKICGDCLHYNACAAWNIGGLANTDAGNCINYAKGDDRITKKAAIDAIVRLPDDFTLKQIHAIVNAINKVGEDG